MILLSLWQTALDTSDIFVALSARSMVLTGWVSKRTIHCSFSFDQKKQESNQKKKVKMRK
jgi:hypothetical protein